MTNIERIIEALSYSQDDGTDWWEAFDSPQEAKIILNKAAREKPDEYNVAELLILTEEDDVFEYSIQTSFNNCMKKLKKELKNIC
jgi:hypothetical protein